MGLATIKILLHHRQREDGTYQVRLRITKDRVVRFVDVGLRVSPKDWNEKATEGKANWLRTSHYDHQFWNAELSRQGQELRHLALQYPAESADQLLARFRGARTPAPAAPDVIQYFRDDLRRSAPLISPRSLRTYQRLCERLAAWKPQGWPVDEITPAAVKEFYLFLRAQTRMAENTLALQMKVLSTVLRRMADDGLLPHHKNPLPKLVFPTGARTPRRRLSESDRLAVLHVEIPPGKRQWAMVWARRAWLLQFTSRGTRIGDVLEWRWRNLSPTHLTFTERKTGKHKRVLVTPDLRQVLDECRQAYGVEPDPDDFILPFLDRSRSYLRGPKPLTKAGEEAVFAALDAGTKRVNRGLRWLAELAGLPEFTSHAARHSFASHARAVTGDLRLVRDLLGHSSEAQTERYLAGLDADELDQLTASVFAAPAEK
ncbi:site-specific integrase [Hymenobacter latericus]|uniref:site-specific integrase n=1 Tax=Hymenobacter sp. YIM 151858-1 TaxID=2987688 RepID=UPI0022267F61|nr:site-specific integrase [Hymenobacter sp. YIM 151858-1]UYZ60173.1 site-specific integrase [Hymenobacter sp. YIM 151858-1]